MLFRTQNNVPEIYVNESRDFQLLCRLKDVVINSTKYVIDSIRHTSNTLEMNSTLLPLLKSKVGFFEYEELTEDQLRYLLAGFPDLVKYKGSRRAIEKAIHLWFRVNRMGGKLVNIVINNDDHTITLFIDSISKDTRLLDEIFKYILPSGYIIKYLFAVSSTYASDYLYNQEYAGISLHNKDNSLIREKPAMSNDTKDRLIGSIGLTRIVTKDELEYNEDKGIKNFESPEEDNN